MTMHRHRGRQEDRIDTTFRAGWWVIAAAIWRQMGRDNLSALAAATAFYALLSIFPTLTALVSLYGLVADPAMMGRQIAAMAGILPPEAVQFIATWLHAIIYEPRAKFGTGLIISVLFALWSVWSATAMLMTAINLCYGYEEKRSFIRFNLEALGLSAGLALVGAVALALVALVPLLLNLLPLPGPWHAVISLVRWPILAALALVSLALLYRHASARVPRQWEWVSSGTVVATALWLAGSVAFTLYVAKVGSYDRIYGSIGAVIVLLLWFYMSAYATLIGAELNAEMKRRKDWAFQRIAMVGKP